MNENKKTFKVEGVEKFRSFVEHLRNKEETTNE